MIAAVVVIGLVVVAVLSALVVPVTAALGYQLYAQRAAADRLRTRARRLGLAPVNDDCWSVPLRGREALLELRPDATSPDVDRPCLHLPVPTAKLRLRRWLGHADQELRPIDDPELADWLVAGGEVEDRAVLTGEVRAALAAVRPWCHVAIRNGHLRFYVVDGGAGLERLEDAIAAAGRLVAALDRVPVEPVERLAQMAAHDPISTLRASALGRLRVAYPDHPSSRAAARRALGGRDGQVALEGALLLRHRERLVQIALAPMVSERARETAAWALDQLGLRPTLREVEALLATKHAEVRRAAVRLARERGAEALLISRLSVDEPLVAGVVEALGDIGTVNALAPLRELHAASSSFGALRGLAEAAMARIRTRAQGQVGGLALATAVGGELAVASSGGELAETTPTGSGRLGE